MTGMKAGVSSIVGLFALNFSAGMCLYQIIFYSYWNLNLYAAVKAKSLSLANRDAQQHNRAQ
jgi:hypothetical protein